MERLVVQQRDRAWGSHPLSEPQLFSSVRWVTALQTGSVALRGQEFLNVSRSRQPHSPFHPPCTSWPSVSLLRIPLSQLASFRFTSKGHFMLGEEQPRPAGSGL